MAMIMGGGFVLVVILFSFFIALIVGFVIHGIGANKKRLEVLTSWAQAKGWTYIAQDTNLHRQFSCPPFNEHGDYPRCIEVLSGTFRGREALSCTFTYTRTTSSGSGSDRSSSTSTFHHHVVMLFLPAWLPQLNLTRETFGTRIGKAFGAQDIQFESEEFNKAWRITSKDLKFAHDIVNPQLMERLMAADARRLPLHFDGQAVLTWTDGTTDLENIDHRLEFLSDAVNCIPPFIWQDHGTNRA